MATSVCASAAASRHMPAAREASRRGGAMTVVTSTAPLPRGIRQQGFMPKRMAAPQPRPLNKPPHFKENDSPNLFSAPGTTTAPPGTMPAHLGLGGTIDIGPLPHVLMSLLGIATGAASLTAIFAPTFVSRTLFGISTPGVPHELLLRTLGAALLPAIAGKVALTKGTAGPGQSYTSATTIPGTAPGATPAGAAIAAGAPGTYPTVPGSAAPMPLRVPLTAFKNLSFSELLFSCLGLVVLAQAVSLRNPWLTSVVGGTMAVTALTTAYALMKVRISGSPLPSIQGALSAAGSVVLPRGWRSLGYSLLSVGLALAGVSLLGSNPTHAATAPLFGVGHQAAMSTAAATTGIPYTGLHVFLDRLLGAAFLSYAVQMAGLKAAVDSGWPGGPAFSWPNAAHATSAGIIALVITSAVRAGHIDTTGTLQGLVLALAAKAAFCLWNARSSIPRPTLPVTAAGGPTATF